MRIRSTCLCAVGVVLAFSNACSNGLAVGGDGSGGSAGEQGEDGVGGRSSSGGARPGTGGSGGAIGSGGKGGSSDGGSAGESSGGSRSSGGSNGSGGSLPSGGSDGSGGAASLCVESECQANASCVTEDGICECDDGYEADQDGCVDIDECAEENECSADAECENAIGSYGCVCKSGFLGDGRTCIPRTRLVSASTPGAAGNGYAQAPALSADGRFIGFSSSSSDLVPHDLNAQGDTFVFDRTTGAIERISLDSSENEADGTSSAPSLSSDGRYAAFGSSATNLVSGDTNGEDDIFVRDRSEGSTIRVSLTSSGGQALGAGSGNSPYPTISNNGMRVSFSSAATNLVPGDTNANVDVFVRDLTNSTTTRVSVTSSEAQIPHMELMPVSSPQIAGGGRYVVFGSIAPQLGGGDDSLSDIFRRDLTSELTEHMSYGNQSLANTHSAGQASLSADGRFIVFASQSSTLVAGDTNGTDDIFIRDTQLGSIERVSVGASGVQANGGSLLGFQRSVSNDGRYVVFMSRATNLANDTNGYLDVFVRDRLNGTTTRVSVGPNGEESDAPSNAGTISADGLVVAFDSGSTTFGANSRGNTQVWVRDLGE